MLRYYDKTITLLEVPGETALAYNIMGCPMKCRGCHSKHLWKKKGGEELSHQVLTADLYLYNKMITAVCFMGGEWEEKALIEALETCKSFGLKTCLYTGMNVVKPEVQAHLDFVKVGSYIEEFGGLDSPRTNQRFYAITDAGVQDFTHKFQRKH